MKKKHFHTNIGISSYCYPFAIGSAKKFQPEHPMSAMDLINKAIELDVTVVQIADNLPLDRLTDTELNAIAEFSHAKGITIETGLRGIQPKNLHRYIDITKRLNSPLLRCVIDSPGYEPDLEEIHSILSEALPRLIENNITLGIENHDRFTTETFAKIVQDINHPLVGIVLDTVNSIVNIEPTPTVLKNLAKYTVNFHVKDYRINRRKDAMGLVVNGTPAGDGVLNLPEIMDVLKKDALSDFNTILELWTEPEETLEKTLEKEEKWVRKSITYLKNIISNT